MKKLTIVTALFTASLAQPQITITNAKDVFNLAYTARYFEDKDAKKSIQAVSAANASNRFQTVNQSVCNFGMTASAFWVKCSLRNETDQPILELGNPTITEVQLYECDSSGRFEKQQQSGNWLPFKDWAVQDVDYRVPLVAQPHFSETFFLRVQHYRGTSLR